MELGAVYRRLKSRALVRPINNRRTYLTTRTTSQLTDQVAVILTAVYPWHCVLLRNSQFFDWQIIHIMNLRFYHLLHKLWPWKPTGRPQFQTLSLSYILISFSYLFLILTTYLPKTNIRTHFSFHLPRCFVEVGLTSPTSWSWGVICFRGSDNDDDDDYW
jgi:hypothetical protein